MLAFIVLALFAGAGAQNPVEFPWLCGGACGSHMVLQRAPLRARLWGVAGAVQAGIKVSASLDGGEEVTAVAGSDGSWELQLAEHPPSTGHVLHVKAGSLAAVLEDVAFGDVYLCGGQSNMEFSLRGAQNRDEAVADSPNYPGLRLFTVGWNQSSTPLANVTSKTNYTWGVSSPETVLGLQERGKDAWFSAVCYYFGRELYKELGGKVPIGLIASNWGGTCVEAWSSPDSLASCANSSLSHELNMSEEEVEDHADLGGPTHNSVLYNAMIAPLLKMRLAGEAWYQGENNAKNPTKYACTFPAMIKDYREKFELPDFSFFYVELAPGGNKFPEARRAQKHALALDNVGFATTIDLGWKGVPVHSPRKEEVGRRLALSALGIRYNKSIVYEGPTMERVDVTAAGSRVSANVTFRSASNLHANGTADCEFNGNKKCCGESPFLFVYGNTRVRADYILSSSGDRGEACLAADMGLPVANLSALFVDFDFEGAPQCALYNGVGGPDDHTGIAAPPFSTSPEFSPAVQRFDATVVSTDGGFGLPFANVTMAPDEVVCNCTPTTQLTAADGSFTLWCDAGCTNPNVTVWARQYVALEARLRGAPTTISLLGREIPNFPASKWRFDGWAIEAQTGNVTGSDIVFLAHPSAYRTPSGRIFMISTAHGLEETAWTQGYWQEANSTVAQALPYQLINKSHPDVRSLPFTARMLFAEGRLLMTVGMNRVSLLENKNLEDPSHPEDWQPAEGDGQLIVNFTGAPTSKHEDYRLHVLEDAPSDAFGRQRKYWLLVVPDGTSFPGRACGRMAMTADHLLGPYTYGGWWYHPEGTGPAGSPTSNCASWPGDLIQTASQRYFVAGWGQLYVAQRNGSALFSRLEGDGMITAVPPSPAFDDIHQIEFTFLPPGSDGRWRMYHASYSKENGNPFAKRADVGFKQAIGMYSFEWQHDVVTFV